MKSILEYINEGKQIDDKLASEIVNGALSKTKVDLNVVNDELSKFNFDMDIVLQQVNAPSKKSKLDNVLQLLNEIWTYVEKKYPNDSTAYYSYISKNLYKFIRL